MQSIKRMMHACMIFGFPKQNNYNFQKVFDLSDFPKFEKLGMLQSLACNPVEVAEPIIAHINSTSYSRRSKKHWATEKMHFTLR